jgi:hypothetical protein
MHAGQKLRDYNGTLIGTIITVHSDGTFDLRLLCQIVRFGCTLLMGDYLEG